jgi:regulator of protease activity HflC (stomatin/prohibitin superfamily)
MREGSLAISDLPGYTSDNVRLQSDPIRISRICFLLLQVPVTCSGSLFYRIIDGYKACFAVSDVNENIRRTGTSAMRSVLGAFSYDQVIYADVFFKLT